MDKRILDELSAFLEKNNLMIFSPAGEISLVYDVRGSDREIFSTGRNCIYAYDAELLGEERGELLRQQIEYRTGQKQGGRKTHEYALSSGYHNARLGESLPELFRRLKQKSPKNPPPAGLKVLATYIDHAGYRRTVTAMCVPAKFEECNCEDRGCEHDCCCEYDEYRGLNYVRAGWYEVVENFDEFSFVPIDGDIDGWWFMPNFPGVEKDDE